jgi:hypothetical protein
MIIIALIEITDLNLSAMLMQQDDELNYKKLLKKKWAGAPKVDTRKYLQFYLKAPSAPQPCKRQCFR